MLRRLSVIVPVSMVTPPHSGRSSPTGLSGSAITDATISTRVSITTRQLSDQDVTVLASNNPFTELRTFTHDTPNYLVIKQHHTGLLCPESPVSGLCTDCVSSGLAIVFHCPATKRSCLIHTPTNFKVSMWKDQMAYVIEGTETGAEVEVIVLKGSARRKSRLDHAETVGALEGGLRELARSLRVSATFTYPEQKLTSGGMTVDKTTGRIEIFLLPSYLAPAQIALGDVDFAVFDQLNKRTIASRVLADGSAQISSFGEALGRVVSP